MTLIPNLLSVFVFLGIFVLDVAYLKQFFAHQKNYGIKMLLRNFFIAEICMYILRYQLLIYFWDLNPNPWWPPSVYFFILWYG
jgi:hypothetical protein